MTTEQCIRCRFAPAPGSYSTSTGDELPVWSCDKIDDPRMPFDMEENTVCPCFEPKEEEPDDRYVIRVHPSVFIAHGDTEEDALEDALRQMIERHILSICSYEEAKKMDPHLE